MTQEEICQAIKNYADIYHCPQTYFNPKWSLAEFLRRKNAARVFLDKNISDYTSTEIKQPKSFTII